MKLKFLYLGLIGLLLAACGSPGGGSTPTAPAAAQATSVQPGGQTAPSATSTNIAGKPSKKLNVALMINGTLGDKGFFDSAKAGTDRAQQQLGAAVKTIEVPDSSNWEPSLRSLAQSRKYDVIVIGTFQMVDAINSVAPDFPGQKFIIFDVGRGAGGVSQPNVANISYKQNEGSFPAGVLAACVTNDKHMKNLSGKDVIGAVGGQDIPVINDFIVGYEQGAKYVDPKIQVLRAYNGGTQAFEDPAKGKELAADLFDKGANVVFAVAGKTGLGVLDAAADANRYAIGVDSDQNGIHPGVVLSSVLKRVDNSVFDLLQMAANGKLQTGKEYVYGLQNNGVGLAEDSYYHKYVPVECQTKVDQAIKDVISGKVKVKSAFTK